MKMRPSERQEKAVRALMAEKTRLMTQAHALTEMGMAEAARPVWIEIAGREERIAPLLAALGQEREAAVHRISAASCHEKGGDYTRAANLYQAALAGPLLDHTRQEVKMMLELCLNRLVAPADQSASDPGQRARKKAVTP